MAEANKINKRNFQPMIYVGEIGWRENEAGNKIG